MTDNTGTVKPSATLRHVATWIPDLTSGLVLGFTASVLAISIITLIFSGDLQAYRTQGVTMALITVSVNLFMVALFASNSYIMANAISNPSAVLAAGVLAAVGTTTVNKLPTALTMIFLATFLVGLLFLIIGFTRLSNLIRYLPYPVMGGFLGGGGLLVVKGAFTTMTGMEVTLANLPAFFAVENLILWVPGVLLGILMLVALDGTPHVLTKPGILLGAIVIFFLALWLTGTSLDQARALGLLLEPVAATGWQPLPFVYSAQADWQAIWGEAGSLVTLFMLCLIILLLNISSIEIVLRQDLQVNRELRIAGFTNIISSLLGGSIGFHMVALTMLNQQLGKHGRVTGIIAGSVCVLLLLGGRSLLTYIPVPLLGGILFYLGMSFVDLWIIRGWKNFSWLDYGIVVVIAVLIVSSSILVGLTVGLFAAIVFFVLTYSRVDIFQHQMSGREIRSTMERTTYYRHSLERLGDRVQIMELRGYLFFGTANHLRVEIRECLARASETPLEFIILDFRRVTGLDSSAVLGFIRACDLAASYDCALYFSGLSANLQQALVPVLDSEGTRQFPDIDRALEACENRLLEKHGVTSVHIPATLVLQLKDAGMDVNHVRQLQTYLERVEFAAGDCLMRQYESADELYFIEVGQVSVYLEQSQGGSIRVQSMGLGTIVGELAFFLNQKRSASVSADTFTIAYRLTRAALERMKTEQPETAFAFNELMLMVVAERVMSTDRTLAAFNR